MIPVYLVAAMFGYSFDAHFHFGLGVEEKNLKKISYFVYISNCRLGGDNIIIAVESCLKWFEMIGSKYPKKKSLT